LNDLFDQGEDEVETLLASSSQDKRAISTEEIPEEEETLLTQSSAYDQSSIFSDQRSFSAGGGIFDFGVDRAFNFDGGDSDNAFNLEEEVSPDDLFGSDDEEDIPATIITPPGSLPFEVSPIVFELGEDDEPDQNSADESAAELMLIDLEQDDDLIEDEHSDLRDDSQEDKSSALQPRTAKSSGGSKIFLIALLLAGVVAYVVTQRPAVVSSVLGPELSQTLGLSAQDVGTRRVVRGQTSTSPHQSQTKSTGPAGAGTANDSGQTSSGGQPNGLGSSSSTSASLRAISQAARGGDTKSTSTSSTPMTPSKTKKSAPTKPKIKTRPQSAKRRKIQSDPSWFSPVSSISESFKGSKREADRYESIINEPSILDTEGFRLVADSTNKSDRKATDRAEMLALGVLHFDLPGMASSRDALNQAQSFTPEQSQTRVGERALAATNLVYDVDGAAEHAIAIGQAYPKDAAAQELMGYAYLKRGQTQKAQSAFQRAHQLDDTRLRAQQSFAETSLRNGDFSGAERALRKLLRKGQGAPAVQRTFAQVRLSQGKTNEAFAWVNNLFKAPQSRLTKEDKAAALSTLVHVLDQNIEEKRSLRSTRSDEEEADLVKQERILQTALSEVVKLTPDDETSLNRLLRRYEESRNWKGALKEVQRLNGSSGGSATLMLREVDLMKKLARGDKAQEKLSEALKQYPNQPKVHLAAGQNYLEQLDYTKARYAFERARRIAPTQPEPVLALTKLLIKDSRVKEAQMYLAQERARRPWSAPLHSGLGDLKLKIAQTSGQKSVYLEAEAAYNQALEIDPSLSSARVQRARVKLELGQAKDAITDLRWLKQQGYRGNLDFEFGRAQQALGRNQSAQRYFKRVLAKDREHLEALRALGSLMQADNKTIEAKRYYEDALAVNSRDPLTRYELGRISLSEKNVSEAVQHMRIATEVKEQDPKLQYWYGRALEAKGDKNSANNIRDAYEKAAVILNQSEETPPELCDVHYRVGLVHSQKNKEQLNDALEDFERASKCAPTRPDVWTRLAESYEKVSDREQMMKNYKRALKQNRNYIPALLGTVRHYLNQTPRKEREAKRALNRILKRNKNNAEAHFHLCKLMQGTSRRKAKRSCQKYLKLAPKGKYVELAKEMIRTF
jgi:tetratricopeptide (TPR) repeat protein